MLNRGRSLLIAAAAALLLAYPHAPAEKPGLTLAILGDVMLGRGVAATHSDGAWSSAFREISTPLWQADTAIANLESPFSSQGPSGPLDLRAPLSAVTALSAAGLDLVSLANNHALDAGLTGQSETITVLRQSGLAVIGPGLEPTFLDVSGYHLGFVAVNAVSQAVDPDQLIAEVADLHRQSDWVIVLLHWGVEYAPGPDGAEVELARRLASAGADVIAGSHPHVLQPVEWIRNGNRRTLIAYSLGNALFDQPTPPATQVGALLLVHLGPHGVEAAEGRPFTIDWRKGILVPADQDTASVVLARLRLQNAEE